MAHYAFGSNAPCELDAAAMSACPSFALSDGATPDRRPGPEPGPIRRAAYFEKHWSTTSAQPLTPVVIGPRFREDDKTAMGFATSSDMRPIWSLYPSFCNGPCIVNPFSSSVRRGLASVRGRREGRHLMGLEEEKADQSTIAWSQCHWMGSGLTLSIVPASGLRFGEGWCRCPPENS